jgi:hypothetical protein
MSNGGDLHQILKCKIEGIATLQKKIEVSTVELSKLYKSLTSEAITDCTESCDSFLFECRNDLVEVGTSVLVSVLWKPVVPDVEGFLQSIIRGVFSFR